MDSCCIYGAWEIILLFDQQCLRLCAPLTSFPHCLVCASQGYETDYHLLYHISPGYSMCSAFWLMQRSLWGHSRCHLLLHLHAISFCLSLLGDFFVWTDEICTGPNNSILAEACGNWQGTTLIQRRELLRIMLDIRSVRVHTFKCIKFLQPVLSSP